MGHFEQVSLIYYPSPVSCCKYWGFLSHLTQRLTNKHLYHRVVCLSLFSYTITSNYTHISRFSTSKNNPSIVDLTWKESSEHKMPLLQRCYLCCCRSLLLKPLQLKAVFYILNSFSKEKDKKRQLLTAPNVTQQHPTFQSGVFLSGTYFNITVPFLDRQCS